MSDGRRDDESPTPWRRLLTARPPISARWLVGLAGLLAVGLLTLERPHAPAPSQTEAPTQAEEAPASERLTAVRVIPRSDAERAEFLALAHDLWSEHPSAPQLDLVVDAAGLETLREGSVPVEVLVEDVEALADAERERLNAAQVARPAPEQWFSEYRDLDTIHAYVQQLAIEHPELAELRTIGQSLEGRPLLALRLRGSGQTERSERTMLIDGGLHAREWISMMATTCVADRLVRGYEDDARLRRFLDQTDLWVIPVANPDGYVHSWRHDRYWRKNRRDGHGVDLNRNFGVAWGGDGSSNNPRSQVYRGTGPFSEPESVALRSLVDAERFDAHIDFHSYGQLLLHPWSYTRERPQDHRTLGRLAKAMAASIKAEHGQRYRPIAGASLYPAAGTLMDWAYGSHRTFSFVIELRPRGGTGFVLPPDQIVPTCDEALAAVLTLREGMGAAEIDPAAR